MFYGEGEMFESFSKWEFEVGPAGTLRNDRFDKVH